MVPSNDLDEQIATLKPPGSGSNPNPRSIDSQLNHDSP